MNTQLPINIMLTVFLGLFPLLSIIFSLIGMKLKDGNVSLFGGLLLLPAMIILLSLMNA